MRGGTGQDCQLNIEECAKNEPGYTESGCDNDFEEFLILHEQLLQLHLFLGI